MDKRQMVNFLEQYFQPIQDTLDEKIKQEKDAKIILKYLNASNQLYYHWNNLLRMISNEPPHTFEELEKLL